MQIETTMRQNYTFIKMAKIKNSDNTKCWEGCGEMNHSHVVNENGKWCNHSGKQLGSFLKQS